MNGNLILTGFSGTGKSHVGSVIACLHGSEFYDIDREIVKKSGRSIASIFEQEGEAHFRSLESQELQRACSASCAVVSTGAGAIINPDNYSVMTASGIIVCLDASPETINARLRQAPGMGEKQEIRPLLAGADPIKKIRELKAIRQTYYELADYTIQTDGLTVEDAAREILKLWQQRST